MTLYKGNAKIRDIGSYGVYHGSDPIGAIYHGNDKVYIFNKSTTWQAGTTLQAYQVSPWCNKIHVDCVASKGATFSATGGNGGRVQCDMTVTPGQTLYISVGAIPTSNTSATYNASDIRTNNAGLTNMTSLQSRLIVAGGGGNGSNGTNGVSSNGKGGAGGGTTGGAGSKAQNANGGGGGTQSAGGAGGIHGDFYGVDGQNGTLGLGGVGGESSHGGGTGGAGYYGGGGAAAGWYADYWGGGGGGGSSYTSSDCSNVTHTQGYQNGAGYITITEIG